LRFWEVGVVASVAAVLESVPFAVADSFTRKVYLIFISILCFNQGPKGRGRGAQLSKRLYVLRKNEERISHNEGCRINIKEQFLISFISYPFYCP